MRSLLTRGAGVSILAVCCWWGLDSATDFASVSPVHWTLMFPHAVLGAVPLLTGTLAGGALVLKGRGGKTLLAVFAITLAQALAVSVLSPELRYRYENTVQDSIDSLTWTPPSSQSR